MSNFIQWLLFRVNFTNFRGGSRRVAKFLSESNTFHIKAKAIKILSCKNFATLLDPPLNFTRRIKTKLKSKQVKLTTPFIFHDRFRNQFWEF